MTPQLRQAYDALDQARGKEYRHFLANMRHMKAQGYEFEHAFHIAAFVLLDNLDPYYEEVKRWSVWNTCEVINGTF